MNEIILPLWVEYTKALGAPVVALIAAGIAGSISLRQWTTAQRKLKLDLFDKRMSIYNDASKLIDWMAKRNIAASGYDPVRQVANSYAASKWLMGREVGDYLADLTDRAYRLEEYSDPKLAAWSRGEKIDITYQDFREVREQVQKELDSLDRIFAPYLQISH